MDLLLHRRLSFLLLPSFLPSVVAVAAAVEWIVGSFAAEEAVAFTPVFLASLLGTCVRGAPRSARGRIFHASTPFGD